MNLEMIKAVGTKVLGRSIMTVKQYAPEILTGVGIIGGITAAVMASKATLELEGNLAHSKQLIAGHKEIRANTTETEYPTAVFQRDMAISYYRGVQGVAKTYGPAIALGVASIACLLGGHGILRSRNAALVAAYEALDTAFKAYRRRVAEEFGEEKEWDIQHGIREEVVEEVDSKGKKTKTKKLTQDPNGISQYARVFAEGNPEWKPNAELNLFWLKCRQTYLNDMLHARGHLFLNEAYDELNFPRTKAGAVVGWFVDKDSDCYVDFGLLDIDKPNARDFVNGYENSVVIDFNVDGPIVNKL